MTLRPEVVDGLRNFLAQNLNELYLKKQSLFLTLKSHSNDCINILYLKLLFQQDNHRNFLKTL
jgi:hypothetical protein